MGVNIGIVAIALFASFFVFLILGLQVSVGIGLASFIAILLSLPLDMTIIASAQKMITGLDNFALLAIPFFILSGNIMNNGGIAIKLVNFAKLIGGRLPGSLAQVNILGNMLFGAISGSAVAAEAAIGGTIYPLQKKEGYDPKYCAAVNITSCPTGLLIPPSNVLIVFALVSGGTSIGALFIAGYLPGIVMGLGIMILAYIFAKKNNYPVEPKPEMSLVIKTTLDALPSLLLIIVVIGGIIKGVFTATEGSGIAVIYTLVLSLIYKNLNAKVIKKILDETIKMTGIIMFLMAASSIMSWALAYSQIPQYITNLLLGISDNKYVILLIINMLLLVVGTFMDMTPAVLIFTPIFLPVVTSLGMHPVHFGILMVYNLCIGLCTPPVGNALFLGCAIADLKIEEIIKTILPYFIVMLIGLLLVTYIPAISLFLPKVFGLI
ncbi:TRAP transporter large permease [Cetobacterium somerae]|uniref:TRAP transporter, DctM subunit n=1 Tax=Cetobacterium somerae ATCC BAA-474 TaxID=1319815 RepID=U7V622_9FUSO|nr:TRAP transporter large permease [Cetobacterium somerae]ERT66986.1 TRAP transporter, DctM subunit [Cetobacterium somerae ATCC BAA-474]WVJ00761.1 TRAP transporter large permease [Cetobacterium somerae]